MALQAHFLRAARCSSSHPHLIPSNRPSLTPPKRNAVKFFRASASRPDQQPEMANKQEDSEKKVGDVMADSFGEGYATRSDEEGFGGIYGGNSEDSEKKVGDVMADSFGEGYATRSDEEGFGGIYGGNSEDPKATDYKSHEYETTQGSHVSEKEKARNQKDANA